ncbi:MAG: hypothetical protein JWM47_2289 [Acidimicrobiales bacterium]|nr:hypothetical protein [Acidimicrobiales bacterium]
MVAITGAVLAHQGGWDEMLLVALPIALFVILLRIANSRATKLDRAPEPLPDAPGADPPSEPER